MNKLILPTLIITLAAAPTSWAGHNNNHHKKADWAKVTTVQPIIRNIEYNVPREVCWKEQVRYEARNRNYDSHTGTILGGIIGGAIGNKVGHNKTNKKIGSVIGVILGASVGHDISNRHTSKSPTKVSYRNERRCEVSNEVRYEEKVIGYHVWYRYHGNEYQTRMDNHPGKRIKVRVNVEPY